MTNLQISIPLLPLALFEWMPPGLSIIAELVVLVGGFYGFVLLVREIARSRSGSTTPAPAISGGNVQSATSSGEIIDPPKSGADEPGLIEMAVIAAVCHLVLTRPHRIVSVRQLTTVGDPWYGALDYTDWSREGRRDIFTSHQLFR